VASTTGVNKEPLTPRIDFSKRGLREWLSSDIKRSCSLWCYSLVFSLIFLHVTLLIKVSFPGHSSPNWFLDVFGNTGIIMVSAIMAITAAFEFLTRRNLHILVVLLIALAIGCYIEYSIITASEPEAGQDKQSIQNVQAWINLGFFCAVSILGLLSFASLAGVFDKLSENLGKEEKK